MIFQAFSGIFKYKFSGEGFVLNSQALRTVGLGFTFNPSLDIGGAVSTSKNTYGLFVNLTKFVYLYDNKSFQAVMMINSLIMLCSTSPDHPHIEPELLNHGFTLCKIYL